MPPQIDPDSVGFLIADVSRLIRGEMDRRIAEAGLGLTPGEGRALAHLARAGVVRQTELADRMGLEAMTVTGYLDRLEAKGMVTRAADPRDRRAKLVQLTDDAARMLARIAPLSAAIRADAAQGVAPEDWTRFLETLARVRANLSAAKAMGAVA